MNLLYRICWLIVRTYMIVFCRLKLVGIENIPETGGFILASNHISAVDPPFLGSSISRSMHYMAKKELFANFILGPLIRNLNAIPVDRGIFDRNALEKSKSVLSQGDGLIMFPEGTRSKTGRLGKGKPGIGMLARSAVVPIVPAYIHNSKIFYKMLFLGKRLIIGFGRPISADWVADRDDSKEGYRAIASEVMERISRLREQISEK